jgi:hypothetical protein
MARPRLNPLALGLLLCGTAWAGQADVLAVEIRPGAARGDFDIEVTVRHADTGWDHYANRWEVLGPQGQILATRTLFHPHVSEQPFTRSLSGVAIPRTTTWVRIRAHDLVHGAAGREVTVSVPHPPQGGR